MKKALLTFILLISALLPAKSDPLRVVLDDNYPPYVFRTENGELRGILVEYWQAWEKQTGRKVELTGMDWNLALQYITEGRADVIDTMFFSRERARFFSFGKPYVKIEVPVFVDRSLQGISDISTLKGFIIGVKSGDNVINHLRDEGIDNFKEYPSYEAIVNAAAGDEVFVFSIDEPPALYYISRLGVRKKFRKAFNLYTGSFHRAVLKGNEKTLDIVDHGFHSMPGNTFTAIERKWTGIPLDYPRYIQTSLYILAAGIAAILLLVTWNNLLKIKVRQKTVDMNRVLLELKRSENHYRELFNNLGDVFFSLSSDGTISLVSPSCLNILGFAPETLTGRKMGEIFSRGSDAGRIMRLLAREGRVNNFRTMVRKQNGETLWVSINAHISDSAATGDKPAVEGLIRDINELYTNELAVKRLGKFREVIIDNTGLLICAADAELKMTLWNKAAEHVTGYGFNEMRESRDPWSLIFPRKDIGLSLIKRADSQDGNAAVAERVAVRAKNGTLKTLDLSVKKVRIPELDDYYIIMGNDLTELLTLENELIKNQKLESLGLLAGGIAHDFNNILTAVTGNLSLGVLVDDHKKTISYIAEALDAVNRAKSLTRQLLTFSTGGAPVKETASVAELLRESCDFLFRGSKIKPVYKIHPDFSTADIDTGQINQVFNNVIINAIQAMDGEGNIEIECRNERFGKTNDIGLPPGQYVMVTIKDDGPGIPPSLADNIFDPFFTTKQAGTGLGLPTSFSIIKRHGGTITFNNGPRGGAVFNIFIPASEAARSPKPRHDSRDKDGRDHSGKILIVDDESSITEILTDMLKHMGYETFSASGSAQALRLFEEEMHRASPFDTVIMDLVLPGEAGGEVTAKKMQALRPETTFIASSGYANNAVMASYAEYGFDGILPKPFTLDDLERCLLELKGAGK